MCSLHPKSVRSGRTSRTDRFGVPDPEVRRDLGFSEERSFVVNGSDTMKGFSRNLHQHLVEVWTREVGPKDHRGLWEGVERRRGPVTPHSLFPVHCPSCQSLYWSSPLCVGTPRENVGTFDEW